MECELRIIKRNVIEAIKHLKTWNGIEIFMMVLLGLGTAVYVATITKGITAGIIVTVIAAIGDIALVYWAANTECKEATATAGE